MLPLLAKEMVARAADRRHYAGRVALAAVAAVTVGIVVARFTGASVAEVLGQGKIIFEGVVGLCWVAVLAVVPATCGATVPTERDRGTIELLRLTRLGPWRLVFELWLGRLVPFGIALLVVAPIGSMAYAFGGVTVEMLVRATVAVSMLAMMVGAMALWFGAISGSPVSGAVRGYASTLVVVFLLPTLFAGLGAPPTITVALSPLAAYYAFGDLAEAPSWLAWAAPLAWAALCLVGAQGAMTSERFGRRRPGRPKHRGRRIRRFASPRALPVDSPLVWRERHRSRWASIPGLVRNIVVVAAATLLITAVVDESGAALIVGSVAVLTLFLAIVGSTVWAANSFVRERARQTLDVLLTTPTPTAEFVTSRFRVIASHAIAGALAFHILVVFHPSDESTPLVIGHSFLVFGGTIAACASIGLWIGIGQRRALRATLLSIAVIVGLHVGGFGALAFGIGPLATWGVMLGVVAVWVGVALARARPSSGVVAACATTWAGVGAIGFVLIEGSRGSDFDPWERLAVLLLFPSGATGSAASRGEPWCCVLYLLLLVASAFMLCLVDGDRKLGRVPARVARR